MKKTVAAISAGLLLVAGQAVAQNNSATVRIGDRVGASAGESSEFAGVPLPIIILGTAALITLIVVATDDDSASN